MTLTLQEILRRCHRAELLPLARLLRVRSQGLGHAQLVDLIEDKLRRAGGRASVNALRRGGPAYPALVAEVAKALELELLPNEGLAPLEGRVVTAWLARSWDELTPEERESMWAAFSRPGEPLPGGGSTTRRAQLQVGRDWTVFKPAMAALQVSGLSALSMVLRPLGPLFLFFVLFKALGPQLSITLPAVVQVAMLRKLVENRVTLGFVGSPSAGKDAGIRAVLGVDSGNIHPVAGSTRSVTWAQVPGTLATFVVNTPGLGDVDEALTEETRQVLEHVDVFVYVLNAEGGVQARELADYKACLATGRPTLVALNKIDVLRPRDQERYIADARTKLAQAGLPEHEVQLIPCAFDPLPQIHDAPIGIAEVRAWLTQALVGPSRDAEAAADALGPPP
ncbi:MAG: 50S ribosome-binding GTPase [Alphaproteobacteria bacterium]|nr:50S ribosome-binding GTPase [Alphaproteobacteria bacterium]